MGRRSVLNLRVEKEPTPEWGGVLEALLDVAKTSSVKDWCEDVRRIAVSLDGIGEQTLLDPEAERRQAIEREIEHLQQELEKLSTHG